MGYQKSCENKKRLKKLSNECRCISCGGAFYDENRNRYVRIYRPTVSKVLKRISNRKVRRSKGNISYGKYRKVFDYWWEVY